MLSTRRGDALALPLLTLSAFYRYNSMDLRWSTQFFLDIAETINFPFQGHSAAINTTIVFLNASP